MIGASNCGNTWMFFDSAESCTSPGCPEPTSKPLENSVIEFGQQPRTQLALDYLMQENYQGGLTSHAGDGSWAKGWGADGEYRASVPFQPLCNCPAGSLADTGELGLFIGYAQAWMGAVMADMWDQLIFAGGYYRWTAMAATISAHMHEIRPSFRQPFGSPRPVVQVEVVKQLRDCFDQADVQAQALLGGPLRAAIWSEQFSSHRNASAASVCAHLVVVNAGLQAPVIFTANVSGLGPLAGLKATRLFEAGSSLSISKDGKLGNDWVRPGGVNIYRIGCEGRDQEQGVHNLATPLFAAPSRIPLASASTVLPRPAWSVWPWSDDDPISKQYDSRLSVMSDTAVAVDPARHSLRFNLPSANPVVLALPGKQLVANGPWHTNMHWKPSAPVQAGDRVVGTSMVLPGGRNFRVSLLVQASPCGTKIELMSGSWRVSASKNRDMEEDAWGSYEGELVTFVTPCGPNWTRLETELRVPAGNATHNGTALQLRLSAPPSERHWGGTVWIGSALAIEIMS
eukprot:SAG31_NODE_4632_length_3084_cov_2.286767_2_plen_513_part_00